MSLKITTSIVDYEIPNVDVNPNNWKLVTSESYRPDRKQYLLDKFAKDFPGQKVDTFEKLGAACSRSIILREWLANANADYAVSEAPPAYLKDVLDGNIYQDLIAKVQELSKINSSQSQEEAKAAEIYRDSLKAIEERYKVERSKLMFRDPYLRILTLNATYLPLSMVLAIENYTPAAGQPDKSRYASECLIQYKRTLIELVNNNPTIDIEKVIEESLAK